jgi:hypothetical protein
MAHLLVIVIDVGVPFVAKLIANWIANRQPPA